METLKDFTRPEIIWFVVGIILLILEFALPGLIIFFFGIGACIVAIVCLLVDISLNVQLTIFILSSVILLLALRKWLRTFFMGHVYSKQDLSEDMQEFINARAVVKKEIAPNNPGRVEFRGTDWDAEADETIPEGAAVVIVEKNNITFKVKPL
ncbi:MAG: NfeD family protein [Planctomycetota bacterium]|jgi:membrane protein implicated in regulation of membrane protease activity